MEAGMKNDEPKDTYKMAYILHFLLGAGNLLPWNAFITAVDYFGYLYPTGHVEKLFSVTYMTCSLLLLVITLIMNRGSHRFRMNLGFSLFIISLMVPPVIDWSGWGENGGAYVVTVAAIAICGIADGLIAGSLIGSAGKLPKQHMQAVFAGTASSGVLVCVLRIITKALLPQTPEGLRTSSHFYFLVSTTILLCCTLCTNLLHMLPFMQHHYRRLGAHQNHLLAPSFWGVTSQIKWSAFGILMTYIVTLSIFPGFIAENLKSQLVGDWYPVLLITVYNVSDFVGKSLTAMYMVKSIRKIILGCFVRLVFYPLFVVCLHGPKWLKTEAPVIVLTFMFGFTNGYLTSLIMILTPKLVPIAEAELAAVVLVVFLGIGLVCGSLVGWFWIL